MAQGASTARIPFDRTRGFDKASFGGGSGYVFYNSVTGAASYQVIPHGDISGLGALAVLDTGANAQVATGAAIAWSKVSKSGAVASDVSAVPTSSVGAAGGVAPLDGGSLIPIVYLPALAITNTSVVASQAAMLALTAQTGDVAIR